MNKKNHNTVPSSPGTVAHVNREEPWNGIGSTMADTVPTARGKT